MKLSTHNTSRLVKATLVSLALAAVAAPQSQAKVTGAQVYRLSGQHGQSVPLVTDHGGIGTSNASVQVYRLVNQRPELAQLVTDRPSREPTVGGRDSGRGFHWRDAGIGGAVLVVVALAAATLLTFRRRITLAKTHT